MSRERVARGTLGVLGLLAGGYGGLLLLRLSGADLLDVVLWMAGGLVVHDAVVAPLTVLAVLALRGVVPVGWRSPVMVGAVVLLTVTATAVPVLGRFGARPDNPTLLDRDYVAGWLLVAAVVLGVVLVAGGVSAARRRGRPTSR